MTEIVKRYPIGSMVRLSDDMPNDEPRIVQGYKQIEGTRYLIFQDSDTACIERVIDENVEKQTKGADEQWKYQNTPSSA